jgi:hypothetical protein
MIMNNIVALILAVGVAALGGWFGGPNRRWNR